MLNKMPTVRKVTKTVYVRNFKYTKKIKQSLSVQ